MIERLKGDVTRAKLAKDPNASLLTTLYAEALRVGKDKGNRPSTDDEVVKTVQKFIKGVEETVEALVKVGRDTVKHLAEKVLYEAYLPKQLSRDEIYAEMKQIAIRALATAGQEKPLMAVLMAEMKIAFAGRYDGKLASEVAKQIVTENPAP